MLAKQSLAIGNNAYEPRRLALKPCINDATDVSNALRTLGFYTHGAMDADLNTMDAAIYKFIKKIQPGSIVVFYFSGHGFQVDGKNYLAPTNANGIWTGNVATTSIDAQKVLNEMYAKRPRLILFILDCCRTLPPTEPWDGSSPTETIFGETKPGLAPMKAPSSTIIAYACAADASASSLARNRRNSLYTYHLLHYLAIPNVDIESLLKYAAADVQKDSKNDQIPYRYSSCNELICLGVHPYYLAQMQPDSLSRRFHHRKFLSQDKFFGIITFG